MSEARSAPRDTRPATFYPVMTCNARCPFCSTRVYTEHGVVSAEDYGKGRKLRLVQEYTFALDKAKEAYQKLRDSGVTSIHIQGGEPTVYEPLAELIRFGNDIGFSEQVLVTNGRMFKDAAYSQRIVAAGVSTIAFSIFGATAEVHDESLGVEGSFDDMLQGVRHVVRERETRGASLHVTGQVILHAKNFRHLPEIVAFWHAQGIRYFGIRLLRDSANTKEGAGERWFFDLSELRPYLERTLDWALSADETELVFSEVFYCLLGPTYLGVVLSDMQTSQRLFTNKVLESKHGSQLTNYAEGRAVARDGEVDPCDACEIRRSCVKVEEVYQPRFTGTRAPIPVRERFRALVDAPLELATYRRIHRLLSCDDALAAFEVPDAWRLELAAKLVAFCESDVARGLPPPLAITSRSKRRLLDIRAEVASRVVRYVKLSELGPSALFRGDGKVILTALATTAAPEHTGMLRFLEGAECLLVEPLFVVFAGRLDRGRSRESIPFAAVLYNDACVGEAPIARLIGHEAHGGHT